MRERTIAPERTIPEDPRPRPETRRPDRTREREGRERERDRARRPHTYRERSERALADVGIYRCVPFRELAEDYFGGNRSVAGRALNDWLAEGLARESTAKAVGGTPFRILSLTRKGASVVGDLARGQGLDPGQRFTYAHSRQRTRLPHDAAIYRAARRERERLARDGVQVRRVRLGGELTGTVARRSERARTSGGRRAADAERHRAARELDLPIDPGGRVLYPDAQIEYVDAGGRTGRVNIEVASDYYPEGYIRARANAGFRMYASGPRAERVLGKLRPGGAEL